jgi:hypothetical protein
MFGAMWVMVNWCKVLCLCFVNWLMVMECNVMLVRKHELNEHIFNLQPKSLPWSTFITCARQLPAIHVQQAVHGSPAIFTNKHVNQLVVRFSTNIYKQKHWIFSNKSTNSSWQTKAVNHLSNQKADAT